MRDRIKTTKERGTWEDPDGRTLYVYEVTFQSGRYGTAMSDTAAPWWIQPGALVSVEVVGADPRGLPRFDIWRTRPDLDPDEVEPRAADRVETSEDSEGIAWAIQTAAAQVDSAAPHRDPEWMAKVEFVAYMLLKCSDRLRAFRREDREDDGYQVPGETQKGENGPYMASRHRMEERNTDTSAP